MPRISRFKLKNSDRSGFKYFEIELVKDGPFKVEGSEFDQPPPSRLPLGGEGDISAGEGARPTSDFSSIATADTAAGFGQLTYYITAVGGITPSFSHPWMPITGSNGAVTITAIPQIVRGMEAQVLTLHCVDSSITLAHGSANAINFMDSRATMQMVSGQVLTFIFNTANQAWNETSRGFL